MDEIPRYDKIERFQVGEHHPFPIKVTKRELALHASLSTKPENRHELLANADIILTWLNKDS